MVRRGAALPCCSRCGDGLRLPCQFVTPATIAGPLLGFRKSADHRVSGQNLTRVNQLPYGALRAARQQLSTKN
jgi:hypothetical protein